MRASSQVAAQRESFARATAALDRAIDVLLPREVAAVYSPRGAAERSAPHGGSIQADRSLLARAADRGAARRRPAVAT